MTTGLVGSEMCIRDSSYPVCSLSLWSWSPILCVLFPHGRGLLSCVFSFPVVVVSYPVCSLSLWSWSTILCVLFPCCLGFLLVCFPVVLVYHPVYWSLFLRSWFPVSLWFWSTISVLVSLSLWSWSTIQCVGVSFPVVLVYHQCVGCLLYTSPSPRDQLSSRMPSSA